MSLGFGHAAYLGWAQESTYGTAVDPPTKFIEIETESLKAERKKIVRPLLGHVSQRRTVNSKMSVGGGFKTDMLWEGLEQILKHALGSVATTGPVGSIYTHTYSLAAALPTGLTLNVNRDAANIGGSSAFQYSGCKIAKLTIGQEMELPMSLECEVLGRTRVNVARTAATFPTHDAVDYAQMTVAAINPASANYAIPVKSLKIVIDNALHEDQYRLTGAGLRAGIGRGGQRKITVEAEAEFESLTAFTYFLNLTNSDLQFKWVNSLKEFIITMPNVTFDGEDPGSDDPGPYYMTITNTALANAADNDELSLVLKNTVSSVG